MKTTTYPFLEEAWTSNPFEDDAARKNSSYSAAADGGLVRLLEASPASSFATVAHDAFREFVLSDAFPCLMGRSALNRTTYRFGAYDRLDDADITHGLARDLFGFVSERRAFGKAFDTFVAVFREPRLVDEASFEQRLWSQLQRLHDLDARFHPWDERVASDPDDPAFSFSFAKTAFFVVGMHPNASRSSRRFAWPALVFNAHEQFETLRAEGMLPDITERIRVREVQLDGSINANLAEYGEASESRQYSGRRVEDGWACPFKAHN